MEAAFEKTLDPIADSAATGKSVAGITKWNNVFWPDLENIFKLVQRIGMM